MKSSLRKYAPYGLYFASLAALISAGLYIVQRKLDLSLQISLSCIALGIAVYIALDPQRIREIFTGRQARYANNAIIMLLAIFGILAVINYMVYKYDQRWDLTEDRLNSLTKETIQTLQSLPEPVLAQAFFTKRIPSETARSLLESYKFNSKGNFDYTFIDPEADIVAAQNANVSRDGVIVLKLGNQMEQVTYTDESQITAALIRLANPGERVIYFLTGHGEFDIGAAGENSYFTVKQTLQTKNYTVDKLNLLTSPKIPEDALAIIIAGPQIALQEQEVLLLKEYLDKGKSLVLLAEPNRLTKIDAKTDPLAKYLAQEWSVQYGNDLIIDPTSINPLVAMADAYGSHPITEKLQRYASAFPSACGISSTQPSDKIQVTNLATTSPNAWGESDFDSIQNNRVTFDQNQDVSGPVTFAQALENTQTNARLAVFCDSDFASDQNFYSLANGDMIINTIDWAAEQDTIINLTPKKPVTRTIIPPKQLTMGILLLVVVFIMPGTAVLLGVLTWIQRKSKG